MTPEQKQQKREKILRLALEYISADPENHDAQSIVKDHIDTAKKALAHASSIPVENWSEEDERRMDIIGSNGNGAYHYSELEKQKRSKYHREIKPGVWVDVYDVIVAWAVSNPALQHLLKKALQPGERGHKTIEKDMQDIIDSAVRAQQIEVERVK